ncbi:SHOCT domain-containing protein [Vibrio rotiferianus]|uniref:SHOCT domain-containing protein n=1 Tax=Vibrio rotiferianus TaxID=190895 RepID=UPI003909C8C5
MAKLSSSQIRDIVANFIPQSIQDNIFIKSLLAGATAIGILLSVPAFAPVGAVGATGWIIVYAVTGGTFSIEAISKAWKAWKNQSEAEREETDLKLKKLKQLLDDGIITEDEYKKRAKDLLDKIMR